MTTCCNSSCQPEPLQIPILARAEVPCPPELCCSHCLLDLFLKNPAFAALTCGGDDRKYAACLALNQADLYVSGSLNAHQKMQATMFIAAHFLLLEQQMALESAASLTAIASGKSMPSSQLRAAGAGDAAFWNLTPYGMMYLALAPINPRFGILGIA
jgi:hypothetical protein